MSWATLCLLGSNFRSGSEELLRVEGDEVFSNFFWNGRLHQRWDVGFFHEMRWDVFLKTTKKRIVFKNHGISGHWWFGDSRPLRKTHPKWFLGFPFFWHKDATDCSATWSQESTWGTPFEGGSPWRFFDVLGLTWCITRICPAPTQDTVVAKKMCCNFSAWTCFICLSWLGGSCTTNYLVDCQSCQTWFFLTKFRGVHFEYIYWFFTMFFLLKSRLWRTHSIR